MKRPLIPAIVFGVCIGSLGLIWFFRAGNDLPEETAATPLPAVVRCVPIQARMYPITESFYGKLKANVHVALSFQIAGRIVQLGPAANMAWTESDTVVSGQVLAQLEPTRYEARVAQSTALIARARAGIVEGDAEIAYQVATLADAEHNLKRTGTLASRHAAHQRDLEKAELEYKLAQAALDAAQARSATARALYEEALSNLTMAEVNLADTILRAPFDGAVARRPTEIGQMVQPGETILSLVDLSSLKLVVGVVERRLPLLRVGQPVKVEVLALDAPARLLTDETTTIGGRGGIVSVIPPAADPRDGLFKVQIRLDQCDDTLHPGMVARAKITVMEKRSVAIPAEAAMRMGNSAYAFFINRQTSPVMDPASSQPPDVETFAAVARHVRFEPTLFGSDHYLVADLPDNCKELVVEGFNQLSDGQLVRVIHEPLWNRTASVQTSDGPD